MTLPRRRKYFYTIPALLPSSVKIDGGPMRRLGGVTILIFVLVVMFFRQAIGLYVDWLWFQDVGYGALFGTILSYKFATWRCLLARFSRCSSTSI